VQQGFYDYRDMIQNLLNPLDIEYFNIQMATRPSIVVALLPLSQSFWWLLQGFIFYQMAQYF
jgi:hypothetical protein